MGELGYHGREIGLSKGNTGCIFFFIMRYNFYLFSYDPDLNLCFKCCIQAHVRGYQVRKQYRKVIWSVSIVEKAILRWRRKRVGLRGFKAEGAMGEVVTPHPKVEKSDEYEFLRIGRQLKYADVEKALSRVKSMARSPEARRQYMRLVANFNKFKVTSITTVLTSLSMFPVSSSN